MTWLKKKKKKKKKLNQEILFSFPSQQKSKISREIIDSSTKENTCESVIHKPNLSTTTSNEKKKKNKFETNPWPFQKPLKREKSTNTIEDLLTWP